MALTALGDVTDQIDDHDLIAILDWTPGSSRRSFGLPSLRPVCLLGKLVPLGATHRMISLPWPSAVWYRWALPTDHTPRDLSAMAFRCQPAIGGSWTERVRSGPQPVLAPFVGPGRARRGCPCLCRDPVADSARTASSPESCAAGPVAAPFFPCTAQPLVPPLPPRAIPVIVVAAGTREPGVQLS